MTQPSAGSSVLAVPDAAAIRDELQRLVLDDLHGPHGDEPEEFDEDPVDRYLLGRLAPTGTPVAPEELDDLAGSESIDSGEGDPEPSAPNVPSMAPSALGFTCFVAGDADRLVVTGRWARYERTHSEETGRMVWRRVPMSGTARVALGEGTLRRHKLNDDQPEVVVEGRARRHDGGWLVSLFLVNTQAWPKTRRAERWIFQVRLSATGTGGAPVFLPRPERESGGDAADRAEQRRLAMAYRLMPEFAVGHGVAVETVPTRDDPMRAVEVRTAAVPEHEIPYTDVPDVEKDPDLPELADLELDMRTLAELAGRPGDDVPELMAGLTPLVAGYRAWIDRAERSIDDPERRLDGYRREAREALKAARRAADRIERGLRLLREDMSARRAFAFANKAMHLQRVHTLAAESRREDDRLSLEHAVEAADTPGNRSWRPFQLAFLLLNLPALADPLHPERSDDPEKAIADLLWFPTGGGKTEAYLGLTAFTLAARRLQPSLGGLDAGDGVAVLMRYTLRLLTIQQFQRATALICACETLRRADEAVWGRTPFRIGLWVGGRVTPNTTEKAAEAVAELRGGRGARKAVGSPHQLTSCPWCGSKIQPGRDIVVDTVLARTLVHCPDVFCPFSGWASQNEGLPVLVVDEEIYRLLPALVIGTVDKFAQLAWKGETATLFGRATLRCERHGYLTDDLASSVCDSRTGHVAKGAARPAKIAPAAPLRPPDLIVQDELHLISGPLGSLTGLYETAVDLLASWEGKPGEQVRPKVIASTATVRRASRQIGSLFHRRTEVFPPQGLNAADSFFSRQRNRSLRPGRRYVGICAHGVRIKSTLIRMYVAVLGGAQKLHEKYGRNEVTDPYMTLVGYFNSLRDLGGMRRLVEDDISTRLSRADERGLARRHDPMLRELTSRLSSGEIPEILDGLGVTFTGDRVRGERRPIDVLLATNMIAVGVDVSRLGVMVVANQPKSTAEYIQATSRVGRASPGLVFTVYNWARPRDLSHYETFGQFHATVYRHVEALSVTPFAPRAIDRGLTGVLMALIRNLETTYNANLTAQAFNRHSKLADHVVMFLKRRAGEVAGRNEVSRQVEDQLLARLDHWDRRRREPGTRLAYAKPYRVDDVAGLLRKPEEGGWGITTCPTSLRDVEPGIRLLLLPDPGVEEIPQFEAVVAGQAVPPGTGAEEDA
ncbi:DISARM system helicase DrmA [Sphaerisporangium sp. NPDC051017]|uniref:DISARM system helicase DrmA n=1 Tax=Sphaerisporangium sp. NPDC051017 TaxID=3154636 RepID=UPI003438E8E1